MKTAGKIALATGLTALAGATGYYLFERNSEQPRYRRVDADGNFEVRDYPALLVAETGAQGQRAEALNRGFRNLADYIFAKRRGDGDSGEKIAMTAPVLQDGSAGSQWRTRFVMPAKFDRATLPRPAEGVAISETAPRRVIAIRFSGRADDRLLDAKEAELRAWAAERQLKITGEPEYAFYNSPFVPPMLRRNEVLLPVAKS